MKDEYVFDNLDTALYKEGSRPSDYLPKHGMPILKYEDEDLVLHLVIYSPSKTSNESVFSWLTYELDEVEGDYVLKNAEIAEFDESKESKDQELPSKKRVGMVVYGKLTGFMI